MFSYFHIENLDGIGHYTYNIVENEMDHLSDYSNVNTTNSISTLDYLNLLPYFKLVVSFNNMLLMHLLL